MIMKRQMNWIMILRGMGVLVVFVWLTACANVAITGRSQLHIIPTQTILSLSSQEYGQFIKEHKVIKQGAEADMVQRVGHRIEQAVTRYFRQHNMAQELAAYHWEFNLVDAPDKNAFCMPGGKVVVYRGILAVAGDETGLAVVMGHEIAHAVAHHGNERMSQGLMAQLGATSLAVALRDKPQETQALAMTAFGVGTQVGVLLPYSRLHEAEADHLGLIFMAMAGYDPRQAPLFWQRMSAGQGGSTPELLSTHPTDRHRMANLRQLLPEALRYYQQGP